MRSLPTILFIIATSTSFLFVKGKNNVLLLPLTQVMRTSFAQDINTIQESVTKSFAKAKSFSIVELTKIEDVRNVKAMLNRQTNSNGNGIQKVVFQVDINLISIYVTSYLVEIYTIIEEDVTYLSKLSINLEVFDVAPDEVIGIKIIDPKVGSLLLGF
jgi:hypothetical protein